MKKWFAVGVLVVLCAIAVLPQWGALSSQLRQAADTIGVSLWVPDLPTLRLPRPLGRGRPRFQMARSWSIIHRWTCLTGYHPNISLLLGIPR